MQGKKATDVFQKQENFPHNFLEKTVNAVTVWERTKHKGHRKEKEIMMLLESSFKLILNSSLNLFGGPHHTKIFFCFSIFIAFQLRDNIHLWAGTKGAACETLCL